MMMNKRIVNMGYAVLWSWVIICMMCNMSCTPVKSLRKPVSQRSEERRVGKECS